MVGAHGTDVAGQKYTISRDEIHEFRKHNHLETQDEHEVARLVAHVCPDADLLVSAIMDVRAYQR